MNNKETKLLNVIKMMSKIIISNYIEDSPTYIIQVFKQEECKEAIFSCLLTLCALNVAVSDAASLAIAAS